MRLMHRIRTRFRLFFISFALIFVVSVFAGLGLGFSGNLGRGIGHKATVTKPRTIVPGVDAVASFNGAKINYDTFYK